MHFSELMKKTTCITPQNMTINVLARHSDRFGMYDTISNFEVCKRKYKPKKMKSSSDLPRSLTVNDLHPDVNKQELCAIFHPYFHHNDRHVDEIDLTELMEQSSGRRLANTVKSVALSSQVICPK